MLMYVYPFINNAQLTGNLDFQYEDGQAKVTFVLHEDTPQDMIGWGRVVNVKAGLDGIEELYTLIERATWKITKIDSKYEHFTTIEITFTEAND